jgi:hypothetical protein
MSVTSFRYYQLTPVLRARTSQGLRPEVLVDAEAFRNTRALH